MQMAQDRSTTDAILTEHFRYTPLSVIDDLINGINTIIYKALTALETGLLSQTPKNLGFSDLKPSSSTAKSSSSSSTIIAPAPAKFTSEVARAEIENGTHALETLLEAAVDKNFDIFELFALQHIFTIDPAVRDWVRLKHYEGVRWPLEKDDVTPEKIVSLREVLRQQRQVGLILQRENEAMDTVLVQLKALVSAGGGLGVLGANQKKRKDTTPLSTTAEFSASQLPGLKVLIHDLRAKMAVLPASAEELRVKDVPGSTSDEQRRRYVEGVAKRAVRENLGRDERDETGLGAARTIGEIRALERLVGSGEKDSSEDDVD